MASRLKLNEVFYSIQGEGIFQGEPTIFIRFHGCNLDCSYCDTKYANIGKPKRVVTPYILVKELHKKYNLSNIRHICITGGEPLLQSKALYDLICLLEPSNPIITVETNGSLIPDSNLRSSIARWVVDYKLPSSGSFPSFDSKWLKILYIYDQLKLVASDSKDLSKALQVIKKVKNLVHKPTILVSPKFNKGKLDKNFCDTCITFCKGTNCRFSLQIHKVIWGMKKGV